MRAEFVVNIPHPMRRDRRRIDGAGKSSHGPQLAVFLAVFLNFVNEKAL